MIEKYRGLDLNLFIVFDALLTHKNVSRAAHGLGRSQSAISHALARLRAYFDDDLFVKTQDGVIPTERALELSGAVRAFVVHANNALLQAVQFDPGTSHRQVKLALGDMGDLAALVPLLDALRAEAPGCTLYTKPCSGDELERALADGSMDIAFAGPIKLSANILQQKLYDHRFCAIVARNSPLTGRISAEQFSAMKEVLTVPRPDALHTLGDLLDRAGVIRNVAVSTHDALIVPHIVASNPEFIAIVPYRLACGYGQALGLRILSTNFELPTVPMCQYFHRRVKNDPFNMWLRRLNHRTFASRRSQWSDD